MAAVPRRKTRTTEPAELAAGIGRFFNRLEDHMASDPANLVLADELMEHLRRAKLRAIARSARAAGEGGDYTIGEITRILGIKKQSMHELMRKGMALLEETRTRLGVVDLRERRRQRLVDAGVQDRAGAQDRKVS